MRDFIPGLAAPMVGAAAAYFLAATYFLASLALACLSASPALAGIEPRRATGEFSAPVQAYGGSNPRCVEWTDGCVICLRDESGGHCSTPGPACQPVEIRCARPAP